MNLGVVVGNGVFVTLIKYFNLASKYEFIYLVSGSIMLVFSLISPFMIIEPPDLKKKKLRE